MTTLKEEGWEQAQRLYDRQEITRISEEKVPIVETGFEQAKVTVVYIDNVTVASIDLMGKVGWGAAKCMPSDQYSKEIGAGIAISRAARHLGQESEDIWKERAVTKKVYKAKHKKGG